MQFVPSTFLALAAIVVLFARGPYRGLWVFMALTPFGAAAAFNLPAVGGASIGVIDLAAVALFVIVFFTQGGVSRLSGSMRIGQPGFYIMLLALVSIISAILFPRLFEGATQVFGIARRDSETLIVLVPLHANTGNLTQLFRILLDVMTFLALASVFRLRADQSPVLKAMVVATLVHLTLGALDVLTVAAGQQAWLDVIRTANYDFLVGVKMGGLTRMVGGFPEASSFGYYALGLFGFWLQYWIAGSRRTLGFIMMLISAFLLIRSTSSSSYVALVVFLFTFGLVMLFRGYQPSVTRRAVSLAFSAVLLVWAVMLALAVAYQTVEPLTAFLDNVLFDKATSGSGVERMSWNTQAWQNFLDTWMIGAGIGSVRASNWLLGTLASLGLVGTLVYLGFLWSFSRLPAHSSNRDRDAVIRSLKAGCLAMFLSAMLTTATPDLGVFFFALAGLASGLSRGGVLGESV